MGMWLNNLNRKQRRNSRRPPKQVFVFAAKGKQTAVAAPGSYYNPLGVTKVEGETK